MKPGNDRHHLAVFFRPCLPGEKQTVEPAFDGERSDLEVQFLGRAVVAALDDQQRPLFSGIIDQDQVTQGASSSQMGFGRI